MGGGGPSTKKANRKLNKGYSQAGHASKKGLTTSPSRKRNHQASKASISSAVSDEDDSSVSSRSSWSSRVR